MPLEAVIDKASFQAATRCTDEQAAALDAYRALLADWSLRFNLVGPSALQTFWGRHALDSWQLLDAEPGAVRWADLGTGAGLPGVVLAIGLNGRQNAHVHLVESLAKRCRFLSAVVGALQLPATVHHARAESLSAEVDVVTARACAPMVKLLGFAEPWMAKGAVGLFLKGEAAESEVEAARAQWVFDAAFTPSASDPRGRLVRIERLAPSGR